MGKGGKSSATPATRKKQASKAAAKGGNTQPPLQRGQKRRTKKEKAQQKKKFVPPQKPPQPPPYPLDSMGLSSLLPDELVMILRRATKKDIITRMRTLEGLLAWVSGQSEESAAMSRTERFDALALAVPCWVYLFPRLAMSRTQRLRLLTLQVHAHFLEVPPPDASSPREELLMPMNIEAILGFLAILAHDTNKQVANLGMSLWDSFVSWDEVDGKVPLNDYVSVLVDHLRPLLLSDTPAASIAMVTPVLQVTSSSDATPDLDAKSRDDGNVDESIDTLDRRLMAGALGLLGWLISSGRADGVEEFIESSNVWSALLPTDDNAGVESPQVRAQAWSLLAKASAAVPDIFEAHLATIIPAAFAGAWSESDVMVLKNMLPSFLPLLKKHSEAWLYEDDESDEEEDHHTPLDGFETWIQTVAPLQPQLCFPSVLVFLSTMPQELLPSNVEECKEFVVPFFAAGETLIRNGLSSVAIGWAAYTSMLCECIVFLTQQLAKSAPHEANSFAGEQIAHAWHAYGLGEKESAAVPSRFWPITGKNVAKNIVSLAATPGEVFLAEDVWNRFASSVDESIVASVSKLDAVIAAIEEWQYVREPLKGKVNVLCGETMAYAAKSLNSREVSAERTEQLSRALAVLLRSAPNAVDSTVDAAVLHIIPNLLKENTPPAVVCSLLVAYIQARPDNDAWEAVFQASSAFDSTFASVLDVAHELIKYSAPNEAALAQWRTRTNTAIQEYKHTALPVPAVLSKLLTSPLAGEDVKDQIIELLVQRLDTSNVGENLTTIDALAHWYNQDKHPRTVRLCTDKSFVPALRAVYVAAHLLPPSATSNLARTLWENINDVADASLVAVLKETAFAALDSQFWSGSSDMERVLAAVRALPREPGTSALAHTLRVLPDMERMDAALLVAATGAPDALLSVYDPLVALAHGSGCDADDVAPLIRGIHAFAVAIDADVSITGEVLWTLPYVLFAAMSLEDALLTGDKHVASALASSSNPQAALTRLIQLATRLISRACVALPDDWSINATSALSGRGEAPRDALFVSISTLWERGKQGLQYARVFSRLLQGVLGLNSAPVSDAEAWMRLALAKNTPPALAGAILLATRDIARETRTYERVRNELVSELSGVPPQRAATEGFSLLVLATCAAPRAEWGIPFVPTQRAVFALQGIHKWLASDSELNDELFGCLAALFVDLAPVVQTSSGRVLELILDTAEENLAATQLDERSSWPTLLHTLKLVETLYSLDSDPVREILAHRRGVLENGIRDTFLALARSSDTEWAEPQHAAVEIAVALAEKLPARAFREAEASHTLMQALVTPCASQMLHVAIYHRVSEIVKEQVRDQVVEMAVSSEKTPAQLPSVLINHLVHTPVPDSSVWDLDEGHIPREQFAYFLTWLALLSHFDEASLSLRAAFAQQLHAFSGPFLVGLFSIIGGDHAVRPLDAARISIDELSLEDLELDKPRSLQALAAHVYVHMLERMATQVRDWWMSERDRQMSLYVGTFTSKYCSPLLATRELDHLKAPDALATLQDDAMSVKVLSSNEVLATYTIDEYPMEIGIRIPPDFPLHGIEIRDIKRIGVSEAQWRAWLLAVQQLLSGKNGLVLDALMLFKHNVETKFQGYEGEECAICYSIISPTDHTLPNKPCRTCRKRFHGSCLFKWVSTSGASTCPLCRSIL